MKLSKDFELDEFACECGCSKHREPGIVLELQRLVDQILQPFRDSIGVPVHISSGVRCEAHNKEVGGASDSLHKKGKAADIVVKGKSPAQVMATLLDLSKKGKIKLGGRKKYDTFNHVDTGPVRTW